MRFVAKAVKWLFVGLVIGLAPIGLKALFIRTDEKDVTQTLLLGEGELFLVAAGLAAAGIGDLLFEIKAPGTTVPSPVVQLMRAVAGVMAAIVALAGAAIYGSHWNDAQVTTTYMDLSIIAVCAAAFCSLGCVILAEVN